jgi:F0F1-type ATP synthase membrane subunit b/b'
MQALLGPFISLGVNQSVFTMLLLFAVTFYFVKFVGLRRLSDTVVERDHRIDGRRKEVSKLQQEYSDIQLRLENEMKKARAEAGAAFTNFRERAVVEQRSILNAARETAGREIKNVRQNVADKTKEELIKLEAEIPALAQMIVEQIMSDKSSRRSSLGNGHARQEA